MAGNERDAEVVEKANGQGFDGGATGTGSARGGLGARLGRLLINRNYALFMVGSFISGTGAWAQSVAIGWVVLELGNSDFLLGLANFAQMVPLLILGFPAGAIVDGADRRKLLILAQAGTFATLAVLALATHLGFISIPLILAISVASGLCNAIGWPTWSVFIKDLVGAEHLRSAVALNSGRFNLTRVIGPALAGVLLARYGAAICFDIAALSILSVIVALLAIRVPPVETHLPREWLPVLKEGLSYAWSDLPVREVLLATAAFGFLAMPYQTFLPAFARDVLGSGPEGLGLLLTAVGVGAIVGAVFSGSRFVARSPEKVMAGTILLTGLALVAAALTRQMSLAFGAFAVVGLSSVTYLSVANASVQLATRPDLIGRVMGLFTVMNAGIQPLGSLAIGGAAERFGLPNALGAVGALSAVLGLLVTRRSRRPARAASEEGD